MFSTIFFRMWSCLIYLARQMAKIINRRVWRNQRMYTEEPAFIQKNLEHGQLFSDIM